MRNYGTDIAKDTRTIPDLPITAVSPAFCHDIQPLDTTGGGVMPGRVPGP